MTAHPPTVLETIRAKLRGAKGTSLRAAEPHLSPGRQEEPPAREMKTHLIREGYPVYVDPERIPGKGLWHRVRIGPYSDRGQAERVASQVMRDEKLNAFVTIERKSRD